MRIPECLSLWRNSTCQPVTCCPAIEQRRRTRKPNLHPAAGRRRGPVMNASGFGFLFLLWIAAQALHRVLRLVLAKSVAVGFAHTLLNVVVGRPAGGGMKIGFERY